MADTKISALTALASADADDVFPIVDTSATTTKKIRYDAVLPAASDTVAGKVELATSAETITGSDAARAVTPAGGAAAFVAKATVPVTLTIACSDETTAISATGQKIAFRIPHAMTVTGVRASLVSACTTGTFTVDINDSGTTILSTKLTIDATEKTSTTAAAAAVISDSALADDAEITIDVDNTGDSTGKGLKVTLIGTRAV